MSEYDDELDEPELDDADDDEPDDEEGAFRFDEEQDDFDE